MLSPLGSAFPLGTLGLPVGIYWLPPWVARPVLGCVKRRRPLLLGELCLCSSSGPHILCDSLRMGHGQVPREAATGGCGGHSGKGERGALWGPRPLRAEVDPGHVVCRGCHGDSGFLGCGLCCAWAASGLGVSGQLWTELGSPMLPIPLLRDTPHYGSWELSPQLLGSLALPCLTP